MEPSMEQLRKYQRKAIYMKELRISFASEIPKIVNPLETGMSNYSKWWKRAILFIKYGISV